jgi:threonine/homoserine/homoserine lactone efflux protein
MTFEQILLFLPAAAVVAASPGANNLLAFANGSRHGLLPSVIALFERCLAFAFMIAIVIAGLGALLEASETAFYVIKWAGVVYLVYLGLTMIFGN